MNKLILIPLLSLLSACSPNSNKNINNDVDFSSSHAVNCRENNGMIDIRDTANGKEAYCLYQDGNERHIPLRSQ